MNIIAPQGVKIIILEGIPGAGKTTIHHQIKDSLAGKLVYDYHEEELLWGWKHAWIPDIDALRLSFMEQLLKYCREVIAEHSEAVFILNRFHISYALLSIQKPDDDPRYARIVQTLKDLSAHVYVPLVSEEEIEKRSSHVERQDPIWQIHLKKRLAQRGFQPLAAMYSDEQAKIRELLEQQGLPYSLVTVETPAPSQP